MKIIFFSCLLASLFCLPTAQSQIMDRSVPIGFLTETSVLQPLGADRWVVAGKSVPYPGAFFEDTLFVAVFDAQGELAWLKSLDVPFEEVHFIHDALVLPDESIVVSFESTLCDVSNYITSLQKLDSEGNLIWEIQSNWGAALAIPHRLHLTPDGNFLGERDGKVTKYHATDGSVAWQITLPTTEWLFDIALMPGTEDFGASGNTAAFQFWKQNIEPGGAVSYSLTMSQTVPELGFPSVRAAENGWFYAYGQYEGEFYRFDPLGNFESMPVSLDWVKQLFPLPDGLLLMGRKDGVNYLSKTGFEGENPSPIAVPEGWLHGVDLAVRGDKIAIAGVDGSGPLSMPNYDYPWFEASHLWFRTFTGFNPFEPDELLNARVDEVKSLSDLTIDTVGDPSFPAYNISGGNFSVLVKNTGSIVLEEVRVNILFDGWASFCPNAPAGWRNFNGLTLPPGESVWLEFGDINATFQPEVPEKYCFWTSAPNGKPDQLHDDDAACSGEVVIVKEPRRAAFNIFPNPATDGCRVISSEAFASGETWRLLDAAGRLAATGACPAGGMELNLETGTLAAGFYLLSVQGGVAKVVIHR